jgi:hypothetical protein
MRSAFFKRFFSKVLALFEALFLFGCFVNPKKAEERKKEIEKIRKEEQETENLFINILIFILILWHLNKLLTAIFEVIIISLI